MPSLQARWADRVAGGAMGLTFFLRIEAVCLVYLVAAEATVAFRTKEGFICAEYNLNFAPIA